MPDVFYLHGFASSAKSTKAAYFAERLRRKGLTLRCPDFNEPAFESLTMTRMLDQLGDECAALATGPVTLIGSSLGGALAVLAAEKLGSAVERLVLLAPAVMFAKPGHHLLTPDRVEEWREDGTMPFFHYGYNEERLLNYAFYEDASQYDPLKARFEQPTLVYQGLRDASVDYRSVEKFAAGRPNVQLSLLDDDHQLMASLEIMAKGIDQFLGSIH